MGFRMSVLMSEATERLQRLPLVSACLIQVKTKCKPDLAFNNVKPKDNYFQFQGLAVGGGAELTTATDWRLVTPQARVAWVQVSDDTID